MSVKLGIFKYESTVFIMISIYLSVYPSVDSLRVKSVKQILMKITHIIIYLGYVVCTFYVYGIKQTHLKKNYPKQNNI